MFSTLPLTFPLADPVSFAWQEFTAAHLFGELPWAKWELLPGKLFLLCAAPVPTDWRYFPKGNPGTQGSNCVMLWDVTLGLTDATF